MDESSVLILKLLQSLIAVLKAKILVSLAKHIISSMLIELVLLDALIVSKCGTWLVILIH
jgi:hypothetical protein